MEVQPCQQATATSDSGCFGNSAVSETRKLAAILVADIVGFSRLAGADEDRILARLRTLRSDLIDPTIAVHHGRVVKRTGDGSIIEFRSVVDAVRCAIEVQSGLAERNAGLPPEKRIEYRVGIHLGDVVEEEDGDLMGDGVNIAARLEGVAKPGAICLSEQAYWQVKGRLDLQVSDLGATQLKNIAEPIHVYSLEVGQPVQAKPAISATTADQAKAVASKRRLGSAPLTAAVATLLLLAAVGGWYIIKGRVPKPAEPAHLSIVVLPFANLSGDPGQDYFADGVTENLTTELSRIPRSFVIARNTAFTYKGKSIDAKEIGKELGVRYVLEGSVQRDQNRVRVNAQLIDAESGAHLWADRFDEDMADLFKLQDQLVARLANSLGNELYKVEAEKGSRSKNPDAIDLIMRGQALLLTVWRGDKDKDKENNDAARALFEQALKIDPNDADALVGEANTYAVELAQWADPGTDYEAKALGPVDRAIALAPDNVTAYLAKSGYLQTARRWDEAIRAADAGLAINPNYAALYDERAWNETALGRFEQAKSDVQQAMRLSPRDPWMGAWHLNLGDAELGLGHFDAAIEEFHKADNTDCCGAAAPVSLAAAYALVDKMDKARSALAEARRREPKLTMKRVLEGGNFPRVFYDGLRKAGLPEE
jgi:TolB-like protein/class 3 adenylate cyclase/Tfp pilus assembly protein PilF